VKFRALVLFPFVVATIFVACVLALPASVPVVRIEVETVKLLAVIGCLAAAFAFERGEYLRRAWIFSGACMALLVVRDVTLASFAPPRLVGVPIVFVQNALVVLANASSIVGTWMMARAWSVSGLEPPGSARGRRAAVAASIVVAVIVGGATIVLHVRAMLRGDLSVLGPIASDLGDLVSLCLIAPVALTALAMRGGVLRWPWGLLTASLCCWLLYDVTTFLREIQAGEPLRVTNEVCRSLACTFAFSAGFAQRRVVRGEG
jgi:hypothetical protein